MNCQPDGDWNFEMVAERLRTIAAMLGCLVLSACGSGEPKKAAAPAKVETIGHETELMKLTLTPDAERRLGIQAIPIGTGSSARNLPMHGEIVAPAAEGGVPITAQMDLSVLAANQVRADGDIERARVELAVAQTAAARAVALFREEAGSARVRDEAQAAAAVARANLRTAQAQRALLGSTPAALGQQGTLWVRVAAFASDIGRINRDAPAQIRGLNGGDLVTTAHPVKAPPSASGTAGTVDLYYAVLNRGGAFRLGQRVLVDLPALGRSSGLLVPASAILRDIYGGEWVYVRSAPRAYERRRIEVGALVNGQALLSRGLARGDQVVTAGAAELFGAEFGAK